MALDTTRWAIAYILKSTPGLTVIDTGRQKVTAERSRVAEQTHTTVVAVINSHWHLTSQGISAA